MNEFILLKSALTNKFMIIRKSMICSVEEIVKDNQCVRVVFYTDCRPEEYVSDTLSDIIAALKD